MAQMRNNLLTLIVATLMASASAQVCVRPVFPFGNEEPTKLVLSELAKRHIDAKVCTQDQPTEIYFYPLNLSGESDQTNFSISAVPTTTGVIGTVITDKPHWNSQVWVVSVHPWGEEESSKRETGYSLKSQIGKVAKWINKQNKKPRK